MKLVHQHPEEVSETIISAAEIATIVMIVVITIEIITKLLSDKFATIPSPLVRVFLCFTMNECYHLTGVVMGGNVFAVVGDIVPRSELIGGGVSIVSIPTSNPLLSPSHPD